MTKKDTGITDKINRALELNAPAIDGVRKEYTLILLALIVIITFGVTIGFLWLDPSGLNMPAAVIIGALIPSVIAYKALNALYKKRAKKKFVNILTQESGFSFIPEGCFSIPSVDKHKILPPREKAYAEDGFQGRYKDVDIALQESVLSEMIQDTNDRQQRRKKKEYRLFWGLIVRIKLRKHLDGHTVIIPDSAMQTFFRTKFSVFKPVRIVSKDFEKAYDVMSTDQVEARVILNPSFIEAFQRMGRILDARWSEVSFLGDEILFAVQHFKPLFEMGPLWKPVTPKDLHDRAEELTAFFTTVDILKENRQLPF